MQTSYSNLSTKIRSRLNPDNLILEKAFAEELSTISYSDILVYVRLAMKGVEPEYTQKSRDAGDKVKDHLSRLLQHVTFKYQGSVMTDTHIKGYSDIDLLVICDKFYTYDAGGLRSILNEEEKRKNFLDSTIRKFQEVINSSNYEGNDLADLRQLRISSEDILKEIYSTHDITRPKSIKITNLSLKRDVDIVIANWYDDVRSIMYDRGEQRGVQIYNKNTNSKESPDYPFISIKRINERSSDTNGRLKK